MKTVTYHALRRTRRGWIEEIRVTREGGRETRTEHIAFYPETDDGEGKAIAAMREANGV